MSGFRTITEDTRKALGKVSCQAGEHAARDFFERYENPDEIRMTEAEFALQLAITVKTTIETIRKRGLP